MPHLPFEDEVDSSTPPPRNPARTTGSAFTRLRAERQHAQGAADSAPGSGQEQYFGREQHHTASMASNTTPGADNFGQQAGGGIAGIALGVADNRPRESGVRSIPGSGVDGRPLPYERPQQGYAQGAGQQGFGQQRYGDGPENPAAHPAYTAYNSRDYSDAGYSQPYDSRDRSPYDGGRPPPRQDYSHGSQVPLVAVSMAGGPFTDGPYRDGPYDSQASNRYSQRIDPSWQLSDPNTIADDGDDGLEYTSHHRSSMLSVGRSSDRLSTSTGAGSAAAAGGAAAGGIMSSLGGLVGRNGSGTAEGGPLYGRVDNPQASAGGSDGASAREKSGWLSAQNSKRKRMMWVMVAIFAVIVLGAIGGGVAGALLSQKSNASSGSTASSGSGGSAAADAKDNGDLSKDSAEIKVLLNNADLRRVFPGVDYTPMYTQYPGCLTYPPSQNNITRDVAVLSQLTNVLRLYGTDCNQTEMVLHAIDRLGLAGDMKLWLGVWQDGNATTNARQLAQMYKVLEDKGTEPFLGAIVGNEILLRGEMTVAELGTLVGAVKKNFTALGYDLPVATSDVGDKWTQALADTVDLVMSNVHPFFTGKVVAEAAEFTWQYWRNQNWAFKPDLALNYIAETGWPTKGGTDCGIDGGTSCAAGSVAGVAELNQFMGEWVCDALSNGTRYFWFEAFDEPWKIKFNEAGKEWEDQWGLMDVDRVLKKGVEIPDCGGKRVGSA